MTPESYRLAKAVIRDQLNLAIRCRRNGWRWHADQILAWCGEARRALQAGEPHPWF